MRQPDGADTRRKNPAMVEIDLVGAYSPDARLFSVLLVGLEGHESL